MAWRCGTDNQSCRTRQGSRSLTSLKVLAPAQICAIAISRSPASNPGNSNSGIALLKKANRAIHRSTLASHFFNTKSPAITRPARSSPARLGSTSPPRFSSRTKPRKVRCFTATTRREISSKITFSESLISPSRIQSFEISTHRDKLTERSRPSTSIMSAAKNKRVFRTTDFGCNFPLRPPTT